VTIGQVLTTAAIVLVVLALVESSETLRGLVGRR
jgi:hypothetical protein